MIRATDIVTREPDLLASTRELYSRLLETRFLEPWELTSLLWSLNYADDLLPLRTSSRRQSRWRVPTSTRTRG